MLRTILSICCFLSISTVAYAEMVEFHIEEGTGTSAWNMERDIVNVRIGDTLRIYNDDGVRHRLHTFGAPCAHGPEMAPGTYWDCQIDYPFSPFEDGPLYDHYAGRSAAFWVMAQ